LKGLFEERRVYETAALPLSYFSKIYDLPKIQNKVKLCNYFCNSAYSETIVFFSVYPPFEQKGETSSLSEGDF
jgi:hypothetical protein